jgi:hypothetical protein
MNTPNTTTTPEGRSFERPVRPTQCEGLPKVGAGEAAIVTKEMIGAAHDVMLAKGDFVLSARLLERVYLAMDAKRPNTEAQRAGTGPTGAQSSAHFGEHDAD